MEVIISGGSWSGMVQPRLCVDNGPLYCITTTAGHEASGCCRNLVALPCLRVGADGRRTTLAEVDFQRAEVQSVDYLVACEVGTVVISWIAYSFAKAILQDVEVERGYHIIIIGVPDPHRAHIQGGNRHTCKRHSASVSQVLGAFSPPVITASRQS